MNTRYLFCALLTISFFGCSHTEGPGPFEKAGEKVDATVEVVGEESGVVAHKTAQGAKHVTEKVGEALEHAGKWVQKKVAPTPVPTPSLVP